MVCPLSSFRVVSFTKPEAVLRAVSLRIRSFAFYHKRHELIYFFRSDQLAVFLESAQVLLVTIPWFVKLNVSKSDLRIASLSVV